MRERTEHQRPREYQRESEVREARERQDRVDDDVHGGRHERRHRSRNKDGCCSRTSHALKDKKKTEDRKRGSRSDERHGEKKSVHRGRKESPSESLSSRSSSGSRGDRCGPMKGISPTPRHRTKDEREWSTTAVVNGPESSESDDDEDREEKSAPARRHRSSLMKEEHTARGRST